MQRHFYDDDLSSANIIINIIIISVISVDKLSNHIANCIPYCKTLNVEQVSSGTIAIFNLLCFILVKNVYRYFLKYLY